jgi:hypothetical protein
MYGRTCLTCGYLVDDNGYCGECQMKDNVQDQVTYDPVNKPYHYNHTDGIECIDYIKQVLGLDGFIAYCKGNAMKYNHRAGYKGNPVEDSHKAQWYINKMVQAMEEKHK